MPKDDAEPRGSHTPPFRIAKITFPGAVNPGLSYPLQDESFPPCQQPDKLKSSSLILDP